MVHNSKLVLGIIACCIYVTISAKLHLYGLIISCRMINMYHVVYQL